MFGRISLARKNLLHEPARLLISVSGVTFAIFLMLVLLALYRGWSETLSKYVYSVDADIWVMQQGSIDMSHSISLLPNALGDQIRSTSGVKTVYPIIGNRVILTLDGEDVTTRIIGFDTVSNIGGPADMIEGSAVPAAGEIIIDEIVHKDHHLNIGDPMTIQDKTFTIVGIASGGPLFQQSYMTQADARALFHLEDITNFFVVTIEPGNTIDTVMSRIEDNVSGVDAQTTKEFATHNEKEIMDKFLPIILVLVFIGFLVGVVIISLTIYTATVEKAREYGVLKAVGAPNRYLYRVVLTQSGMAGAGGFAIGVILTYVGSDVIKQIEPLFVTLVKWQDIVAVAGMTVVMIILAAYIPLRRLMKIDPAIVFKA
ncbi:MAG: FtsX-like permease family protein [Candidatus Kerfeldbacteria bacterium]|nr:FtsX-like permease family protein [Candidatus Kerfeldbacteria bacterium]